MPKTTKKRTFRKRRAFNWENRETGEKKLDPEMARKTEKDPDALEMGEYADDGKGLPKVKKESAAKAEGCGPRVPAMKKERGMPRKKGMNPYGAEEYTEEDDTAMMREMGQDEEDEFELEEFDLEDLDFGDLPELDEDEVEEVEECPPGCVPEVDEEEEGEEEEEEGEEEEEEGEEEEEEGEAKEASVEEEPTTADVEPEPDSFSYVLAEDQLDTVDIRDLDFPLFDPEGDNPHYLVLHKGEPVAKIALSDQPMPEDHRGPFLNSDRYIRTLTGSIERIGLGDTLKMSHAKIYAAQATKSALAEEMKKEAKADMDQAFRNNLANLHDNLMNTVALAIDASNKNLILENPLKDALVTGMRRSGISERGAVEVVEAAFRDKGMEYFQALTAKAQEWLGLSEEAYKEITAMVATANYAHPEDIVSGYNYDDEDALHEAEAEETPVAMPRNVPLRSVASSEERRGGVRPTSYDDIRNDLRGRLNVRGKLTSR